MSTAPPSTDPLLDELFELILTRLEAAAEMSAQAGRGAHLERLSTLCGELQALTASAALIAAETRA